ncbi:MAG: formate--phosphoribosylaminoimidazolecarboxamide ligase [Archaeoglobi archaeon]|nr:formate--phosphoribosylaminoimidazolecarboxamide ligase [Candidatus Mnemosynella sp.]
MIEKSQILEILENYDMDNLSIATLASHTSLHILKGAQEEGFRSIAVCVKGREVPYQRLRVADEIIFVDHFAEMNKPEIQEMLRERNALVVPHGSFVAYVGLDKIENEFFVPMIGNRRILRWESERDKERQLLEKAGIRIPKKIMDPRDIDRPVIVKFPGARGGRGYFITDSPDGFNQKVEAMIKRGWLSEEDVVNAHIEEYIPGTNFCLQYFYSPIFEEVELMGMDRRFESNIDGLTRMPARDQLETALEPSYVVTGNIQVAARESLLEQVYAMGDALERVARELVPPGLIGPFCIQTMCTENLEFVAFEISARMDGGTNVFMNGSPYSYIRWLEPMSSGRRLAREVKMALERNELEKLIT